MPRGNIDGNIAKGILTTYNVSELTGISISKIRQLCENKTIFFVLVPGTKERRIPAGPLVDWLKSKGYPVSDRLELAARNFNTEYSKPEKRDSIFCQRPSEPTSTEVPSGNATPGQ